MFCLVLYLLLQIFTCIAFSSFEYDVIGFLFKEKGENTEKSLQKNLPLKL